jgi:hypothetical protein
MPVQLGKTAGASETIRFVRCLKQPLEGELMAYSNFTLAKARAAFGFTLNENRSLFEDVAAVQPSDLLKRILDENLSLATAINSEKLGLSF